MYISLRILLIVFKAIDRKKKGRKERGREKGRKEGKKESERKEQGGREFSVHEEWSEG